MTDDQKKERAARADSSILNWMDNAVDVEWDDPPPRPLSPQSWASLVAALMPEGLEAPE